MTSMKVDGQDVEAVYDTAQKALKHARDGKGPVFVLVETYRLSGHYVGDPQVYRPKEELRELRKTQRSDRDAARRLELSDDEWEAMDAEVTRIVEDSVEFAKNAHRPEARRRAEERLCLSRPTARPCATR